MIARSSRMDSVGAIADAQGFGRQLGELQALRRGRGIRTARDVDGVSRQTWLSLGIDPAVSAEDRLDGLLALIDQAPSTECELLTMAYDLSGEFKLDWMDRTAAFAERTSEHGSARTVRRDVDLALISLLMRQREAGETVPSPPGPMPDQSLEPVNASRFFIEDYVRNSPRFVDAWGWASSIDMMGFGHNRMVVAYSHELIELLARGGRVRVLLQDPGGDAVIEANRRSSTPKASDAAVRHQHEAGLSTLRAIRSQVPHAELDVRVYDILPPFTAYFFRSARKEVAFVWFWSWRQPSAWRPGFSIARLTDPIWYERFSDQFDGLWNDPLTQGEPQAR